MSDITTTGEPTAMPETFTQQPLPGFDPSDKTMVFMAQLADRWRVAKIIGASGLTKHRSPEAILAIMMWGYELDVPPMLALRNMYFFDGNLGMSADLMAALFIRNGGKIEVVEWTTEKFRARFSRPGWEPSEVEYTVEDAQAAGLLGKANWKNRKAMLSARGRAMGCRAIAPDVFAGQYTTEELRDIAPEGATGVGVHVSQVGAVASRLREIAVGAPVLSVPDAPTSEVNKYDELDAAGLSGDVAPVERLQADAAPAAEKLTALAALSALVADTRPTGKAPLADERTLVSLRQIAMAIGSADSEEAEAAADGLLALANDPKLAAPQAVRLQSAALLAAEELGVRVGGAVAGDELALEG